MPASEYMPDVTVEIAFTTPPDDPSPDWVDVSDYVEAATPVSISRGRADELTEIQPSRLQVTLDNSDGRFTPGNTGSPYYPNVKKGRRVRVSTRWPLEQAGNLLTANQASFETSVADWIGGGSVPPTLTQSTSNTFSGTKSMLVTWGTGGIFPQASTVVTGLVIGRTYTASAYVFVPAGASPFAQLVIGGVTTGIANTTRGVQQRITVTFTATATSHDLHVWPASAATAGHTVYVDAVQVDEGSTSGTFTTATPPIYRRFTGYIDEWPVQWPTSTDTYSSVTVTASSRRARLAQSTLLRSLITEEWILDEPSAYYPLNESQGIGLGSAGDISGNGHPNLVETGTGNAIQWGSGSGPVVDAQGAAEFGAGRWLLLSGHRLTSASDTDLLIEAFITTTAEVDQTVVALFNGTQGPGYIDISVSFSGTVTASGGSDYEGNVPISFSLESAAVVNDGLPHHVALRIDGVAATLFVDGVSVASDSSGYFVRADRMSVGAFGVPVGAASAVGLYTGSISHLAVFAGTTGFTDDQVAAHAAVGLEGFAGDLPGERITRIAGYGLVGLLSVETGTTSVAAQQIDGRTAIEVMDEVADTADGILFDRNDGYLVFHDRAHRYNPASAATLDASLEQIEASLVPKMDGQRLVNDVTANRPGGAMIRSTNADSVTEYGLIRQQVTVMTTSDNQVVDAANWLTTRYGEPDIRISGVAVDLTEMPSTLITDLLALELGDRITLDNLPDQAPAPTYDGFVEGVTESIGADGYLIGFEISPAAPFQVWELDSATHSQLGTTTVLAY